MSSGLRSAAVLGVAVLVGVLFSSVLQERATKYSHVGNHIEVKPKSVPVKADPPVVGDQLKQHASLERPPEESKKKKKKSKETKKVAYIFKWFAPFFSGGGYCSEAAAIMLPFANATQVDASISQHGDSVHIEFVKSMKEERRLALEHMMWKRIPPHGKKGVISVCHSEPGAWSAPYPAYNTVECPPRGSAYNIGRTMFETDRLPEGWSDRLNFMDEVWVPTRFHEQVFIQGGVDREKIHIVGEPVDSSFFNPDLEADNEPFPLPMTYSDSFKFLSIFKWEERKGWRFLVQAFLDEFEGTADAELFIHTRSYHTEEKEYVGHLDMVAKRRNLEPEQLNRQIHVIDSSLSEEDLRRLYAAADCLVIPSRGEGWGRPHAEAMAMAMPVIATGWSGNTAFMSDANSYLIDVEDFEVIQSGAFTGHRWAKPSVKHLRKLMRHVMNNPDEARVKGQRARKLMVEQYTPEKIAFTILGHLRRIERKLESR